MEQNMIALNNQKKSKSTTDVCKVRKLLSGLAFEEVATTPKFNVAYIGRKQKPKIVKYERTSSLSTTDE